MKRSESARQLVADKIAIRNKLIARLEGIFNVMDREESGMITEERLSKVLANPKAAAYFQTLDLDVHEGPETIRSKERRGRIGSQ
eukprot:g24805.t1